METNLWMDGGGVQGRFVTSLNFLSTFLVHSLSFCYFKVGKVPNIKADDIENPLTLVRWWWMWSFSTVGSTVFLGNLLEVK